MLTLQPDLQAATQPEAPDDWSVITSLGAWAISVDGEVSVGEHEADFSADFDDLLDHTNFALMPGIEVRKGRWAMVLNGVITELESERQFSRTFRRGRTIEAGADVELDLYIADLALGYRLIDLPLSDTKSRMVLSISPAVGVRYTYFSLSIDPDRFDSRERSKSLWDPYVGGRVNLQITTNVGWRTEASIGAFGGSELTWSAQSFIDWQFYGPFELNVGYRAIYWDYDEGNVEIDTTMHGPWVGMSIYW